MGCSGVPKLQLSRFLRLIVRCLADSLALKYHQGTVNRKPDVFALLSPKSILKKLTIVNAQLTRGMSANPFLNRFAMMLMNLVKSAMMWLSRFQNRLMRLNARLSTPRNAHNPVVDMETNLFYRYIVFRQNIV